ncbi:MAG: RnfABCDGE type electron transport complex subunit A [Peptococcaceae bacterium]|jgi:electron transport complex protein RnfA|nr:RnfABCDGE type electron transport complex subunit A [Peptococcaceae bacterium]
MAEMFALIFGSIFISNIVLAQFLGICPFLGVSKNIGNAVGMGLSVMFVMMLSSALTWLVYTFLLVPFQLEYLKTIAFILTIAALVQLLEMFLKKNVQGLYKAMGVYLPLITTNCTILGIALVNIQEGFGFFTTVVNAFANSAGFLLAMVLMAGIRERLEEADLPLSMQGLPIVFFVASSMALAFVGFTGMI